MTDKNNPILEPKTQAFIDALAAQGGKPLYELSYADARKVLEDAQAGPVTKLPADVEDKILPAGPTGEISVRIYRPKGARGLLPVVMYFHGGGWVLGSKDTEMVLGRVCSKQGRPQENHRISSLGNGRTTKGPASGASDCGRERYLAR